MLSFKSFLTEGGAGGHVLHPFDAANNGQEFLNLFDEVTDYIEKGSAGKPGSAWVKLDGINLSVRLVKNDSGKFEFALDRGSQLPLDVTGITVDNLDSRGMNPGLTQKAKILLDLLNPTINSTMKNLTKLGLTTNPNLILNVEFVDNYKSNQITYDIKNFIAIHGLRIIKYSDEIVKKTGYKKREISDYPYNVDDINAYAKALTVLLKKKNDEDDFVVLGNPEVKKIADINLNPLLSKSITLNGVSKSLKNWILDIHEIPKKNDRAIIFTKKVYQEIDAGDKTGLTPDQIRDYILYYSTIVLGEFIMNSVGSKLGKGSDQEGLMIKRKNGEILKITGRFILSGLEGNFAKTESIKEDLKGSFAVGIMFGRFNPPHIGHIAAWKQMSDDSDLNAWYVGTNKSTIGKKDPLPSEVKEIVIKTLYPEIKDHFVFEQTWLTLATYVYEKYKKDDITLICYTDEQYVLKLLKDYNDKELKDGKRYIFSKIILRPTERISSATDLRAAVTADDKIGFSNAAGIPADIPITVGGKKIEYFDLVKSYLQNYMEEDAEPMKYFAKLSKSTSKKRSSFWKALGTYPFTKDEYKKADKVPGDSKTTRSSKYNKKYNMMFGEEKTRSITALKHKSKATGVPYSILKQVYNRGMAAWVTGHRPGATQSAWAFARVNSFLTKGKTWYSTDADLAKKTRKYLGEAHMFPQYFDWGWIDNRGNIIYPDDMDKTHTSILRRLSKKDPTTYSSLGDSPMETDATNQGWIRWLVEYTNSEFIIYFNTRKLIKTIKMFRSIEKLIMKHSANDKLLYSFDSGRFTKVIETAYRSEFIKRLSALFGITESVEDSKILYRAGSLEDPHNRGIFLSVYETTANRYASDKNGETQKYILDPNARVKTAINRWSLVKDIDPTWDKDKIYNKFVNDQSKNNKLIDNMTAETRLTIESEKRIKKILSKQGYGAVNYSGGATDQSGEYQVFNRKDLKQMGEINEEDDYEIEMATGQLQKIIDVSSKTLKLIQNKTELPAWIQDKISISTHNAEAIFDYYNYSEDNIHESIKIISETITYSKKDGKKLCFVFSNKGKKSGSQSNNYSISNIRLS